LLWYLYIRIRTAVVSDKISIEERSLKYFIGAWVIFIIALAARLAISIQQYVAFQQNPLLQPYPYIQIPQQMPYVILCYDPTLYTFNISYCFNASLTTPVEFACSYSFFVPTNSVKQCVLFNTQREIQIATTNAYMNTILILDNITVPVIFPTISYITENIMNTSDFIANITDVTFIPLYTNAPVFVGIQKQETVTLSGTTKVTYASSISTSPSIPPPTGAYGPNANTLQILVYFTSFTVNSLREVNPMGIFDIFSSLGGIYSIIGAISGVLFIASVKIKSPKKKNLFYKKKNVLKTKNLLKMFPNYRHYSLKFELKMLVKIYCYLL